MKIKKFSDCVKKLEIKSDSDGAEKIWVVIRWLRCHGIRWSSTVPGSTVSRLACDIAGETLEQAVCIQENRQSTIVHQDSYDSAVLIVCTCLLDIDKSCLW